VQGTTVQPRTEFSIVASKLSSMRPSLTAMAQYEATNAAPATCTQPTWAVSSKLGHDTAMRLYTGASVTDVPIIPSESLCSCMMESLSCISAQKNKYDYKVWKKFCPDDYTPNDSCMGAFNNYTSGQYGTYASCRYDQISSWVLNQEYMKQDQDEAWCAANNGTVQKPISATSQSLQCREFARQAGVNATGRITATPQPDLQSPTPQPEGKMSSITKVGVALGIVFLLLLLVGIALWVRVKKLAARRKAQEQTEKNNLELGATPITPEAPLGELSSENPDRHELFAGKDAAELSTEKEAAELGTERHVQMEIVELDGNPIYSNEVNPRRSTEKRPLDIGQTQQAAAEKDEALIKGSESVDAQPSSEPHNKPDDVSPIEEKKDNPVQPQKTELNEEEAKVL
jgi:hypothetical protein